MHASGLQLLVNLLEFALYLGIQLGDRLVGGLTGFDQMPAPDQARRRVLPDRVVERRLGIRRLIHLVMPMAPVADEIDHEIVMELSAVGKGQPDRRQTRFRIVGVHVNDRDVEPLCHVAYVVCGPGVVGVGCEPQLVVHNDVQGTSHPVTAQRCQVERLGHDPFSGEGGITMHRYREYGILIAPVRSIRDTLGGPRHARQHRIHELEVTRIGHQPDIHLLTSLERSSRGLAEMVFHVASTALGVARRMHAGELVEQRGVRLVENVRQHVDAATVRHRDPHIAGALAPRALDRSIDHWHQNIRALDREPLGALICPAKESLQSIDFGEAAEHRQLLVRREHPPQCAGLDLITEPLPLPLVIDVFEFEPHRRRVQSPQPLDGIGRGIVLES